MTRRIVQSAVLTALTILPIGFSALAADDQAVAARRIMAANKDAVVTVKLVIQSRISFGGRDQKSESRTEAIGTVIDPSGLTVLSLSSIDPSKTLTDMVKARTARSGQHMDFSIDCEVSQADIILADGTEIPASVVLRDKELDLAFLRPKDKPAQPLVAVDLSPDVKPLLLDTVVCLNRLGQVANRVCAVSLEHINAMVDHPRPFYVLGTGQGTSGIGGPIFTLDGKPLGLLLLRSVAPESEGNLSSMFSSGEALGIMPIVVPAADIRDGAKQAMTKPAEEPKPVVEPKPAAEGKPAADGKPATDTKPGSAVH
jgi:hypothetical protein